MGKAAMMVAAGPSHLNSGELSRVDVLGVLYEGGSGGRLNSRDLSRNPVTARRRPPEQEIWLIAIPPTPPSSFQVSCSLLWITLQTRGRKPLKGCFLAQQLSKI